MILCIYHHNCADGFGAAWAVRHALGADRVEFHAGVYQTPPPDVDGRDVVLVDFSYKRPVLDEMARRARSVLVLDHHKSAADDLADCPAPVGGWDDHLRDCVQQDPLQMVFPSYLRAMFAQHLSGAKMAWHYFNPGRSCPPLINHIEDRDLWRFALEGTREIQAALFSHPYDFEVWDELMTMPVEQLRADGAAIERKHHKDIAELLAVCKRRMKIGGHNVPVASLPYTLSSDAGHLMAQGEPFAACYWDVPDGRVFSLRSRDDGVDVSEIARQYGGGGHRNAAGFRVGFAEAQAFEVSAL